jgi:serine phosphatase RsbU (regulator of sigma subunit)
VTDPVNLESNPAIKQPRLQPDPAKATLKPGRLAMLIGLIGVVITASSCWAAWTLNRDNEHRLLQVQTRQAGDVIASTILGIENPLTTALQVASVSDGSTTRFSQFLSAYTGAGRLFVSASLWRTDGTSVRPVASVGVAPLLLPTSSEALAFITRALHSSTVVVAGIPAGSLQRIGYAVGNPASPTFAVYAERAIPANRRASVEGNSAFSDLNYATYLGATTRISDLATTNVALSRLPLSGDTARDSIPFGDTTLTLVATPSAQLGGALGEELPWILAVGGALLTIASALVAEQLVRRRREAERDAGMITRLYDHLDTLFAEQRTIAETLQRALLPQRHPSISNLEIASRYLAGAEGVDIGGDWYSLIRVDDRHFAFVVGDVSGRGVGAATLMARLRFTIRAYLLEGHAPDVVLEMCSRDPDVIDDGHFATVLVGVGDLESGEITLANAGHLNPLLLSGAGSEFVSTHVGLPLGIAATTYRSKKIIMATGSALLAFTDGLVERRGEDIDIGLRRLAEAATALDPALEALVGDLVSDLAPSGSEDDIAILAFRWLVPARPDSITQPETATAFPAHANME